MAVSPLGNSFSNFPNTGGLEKLGLDNFAKAVPGVLALTGVLSGLKGDPIGKLVETAARSIKTDPQTAAELARQITQLGAAVVRASAKEQEVNAANAQPFVEETTTTKRVEVGEGGVKKVKTTTTTVTERTNDPKAEAAKARVAAQQLEQFGSGLVDGKINLGDETFTFSQVANLISLIDKFEKNGRREESKEASLEKTAVDILEKPTVDINESGVVKTDDAEVLGGLLKEAGIDINKVISPKPQLAPETISDASPAPQKENVSSADLDSVAGLAKTVLGEEQLTQLKQLASHLDDNQLAALIRKIVAS